MENRIAKLKLEPDPNDEVEKAKISEIEQDCVSLTVLL